MPEVIITRIEGGTAYVEGVEMCGTPYPYFCEADFEGDFSELKVGDTVHVELSPTQCSIRRARIE